MDKTTLETTRLGRLLSKLGGYYILAAALVVQFAIYLITIPISFAIRANAEYTNQQFATLWLLTIALMPLALTALLIAMYALHRDAFVRLQQWSKGGTVLAGTQQELDAWKQISALPWHYGLAATLSTLIINFLPILFYGLLVLRLTLDQFVYTFIGILSVSLTVIILGIVGTEQLITPARIVLRPRDFDAQLSGAIGLRVFSRLTAIILALIAITVLLIAPIGYHFTFAAIQKGPARSLLFSYQLQSIISAFLVIGLGFLIAVFVSRSVSTPLNQLIETFKKVEAGDLAQDVPVISTDEIGGLAVHFNRMIARLRELQETLGKQVAERTAQLKATNEVGHAITSILDQDQLIAKIVNLITSEFGYYYTALFILDPTGKWAELKNATGEAGRVLKENKHRLAVDGKSMVGTAIRTARPRVSLNVGVETLRFENPLLPYTRSELALPLVAGERVLGALDVQSTQEGAFGPEDVDTLQGMANQVAIALENARLFEEAGRRLEEMKSIQRQYIQGAWKAATEKEELQYRIGDPENLPSTAEMAVPISLRDEVIGQINLAADSEWTAEQQSLIENVASQAALALENARLIEESQAMAARERLIAEITGKVWSSTTVEGILQTAIRELSRALDTTTATIELKAEE